MKTSAATAHDLARSVIAVPPLARLPSHPRLSARGRDRRLGHTFSDGAARTLPATDRAPAWTPAMVGTA
ncbi:MAG: hypothetical protein E6H55_08850 [Betaproteobacteria bacterium]|nr:MAG: hypothetical protein E6H55_08850 [Betaproteobacteria bacterium]